MAHRVYLGRDHETNKRKYHNRTIHGPMREAQAYLTGRLRERDLGRDLEDAKITLNEYLDRWLETAVKPRVREKTWQDYSGMLRRYVRPSLGERLLTALRPLDLPAYSDNPMDNPLKQSEPFKCSAAVRPVSVILCSFRTLTRCGA
jgi:hypothetical protein